MAEQIAKWKSTRTGREYDTEAAAIRDEAVYDLVCEIESVIGRGNMEQAVGYLVDYYILTRKPAEDLPKQDIPF